MISVSVVILWMSMLLLVEGRFVFLVLRSWDIYEGSEGVKMGDILRKLIDRFNHCDDRCPLCNKKIKDKSYILKKLAELGSENLRELEKQIFRR